MIRIPTGGSRPSTLIAQCTSCHPAESDRGGFIETHYPCWYTVAEAEALKSVLLGVRGANPRAVEIEVSAAPEHGARSTLWHLATESQDSDWLIAVVANAFDIPRLVRRDRGFEQQPCDGHVEPVKTPLARDECAVVALHDLVITKPTLRKCLCELTLRLGVRIEAAREEATRDGRPKTATVWIAPMKQLYIPARLIPDQCRDCPEIRPEEDQEPLE